MADTIRQPGKDIEYWMGEAGQKIRDVRPIQDGFQGRQQDNVDARPPRRGYVPCAKEGQDPHENGRGREEELRSGGDGDGRKIGSWNDDLEQARVHNVEVDAGE